MMKHAFSYTFIGLFLLARPVSAAEEESKQSSPVSEQAYAPLPPSSENSLEIYSFNCDVINRAVKSKPNIEADLTQYCLDEPDTEYRGDADRFKEIIAFCANPRTQPTAPLRYEVEAISVSLSDYFDNPAADRAKVCSLQHKDADTENEIAVAGAAGVAFGAAFQQQLVEALSGYLIKRAKAEALNWAGDRMGVEICKADAEGKQLLPNVCAVVFGGDAKSTAPGISWSVLRQAAIQDFRALPPRLVGFIDRLPAPKKNAEAVMTTALTTALTLGSAWNVSQAIASGDNTLESIAGLASYTKPYTNELEVARFIHLVALIAEEARGNIYEGVKTGKLWKPSKLDVDLIIAEIINSGTFKETHVKFLRGDDSNWKLNSDDVVRLIGELSELAALAKQGKDSGADEQLQQKMLATLTKIFATSAKITRSYLKLGANDQVSCDIANPDAGKCTVLALEGAGFIMGMTGALVQQEYGAAFAEFMAFYRRTIDTSKLPDWFTTWLPFIADLASAKDAETMQGVLESIAAPVGSYKVKRGSVFVGLDELPSKSGADKKLEKLKAKREAKKSGAKNMHVMLNAYVGVQGGAELLLGDGGVAGHLGPTVSIGPELSWGLGKGSSFSFYAPLLDVGMLGDFRLGGKGEGSELAATEDVEATPNIGFAQVFAPGLFMMFGLGQSPLALGLGAQIAPALRATTSTDTTVLSQDFSTLRVGGFLAIDIPVFIFR